MNHVDPKDILHLVILGHPVADSFNGAVTEAYCDAVRACGQRVELRDLYSLGFDPVLQAEERPDAPGYRPAHDVRAELELVRECAIVTLIYPLWFGMPPAIVKGYIDRVLGASFTASAIKAGTPHPLLHGKRLLFISSSASTRPWLEERGQWVALHQAFDTYLTTIFSLEGSDHLHFDAIVPGLADRFVRENLEEVRQQARLECSKLLSTRHARRSASLTDKAAGVSA